MLDDSKVILLVEDNPDDEALTLRALRKNHIPNEVVVAHDGVEALEWLFARAAITGRDVTAQPQVILLDLKLPAGRRARGARAIRAGSAHAAVAGRRPDVLEGGRRLGQSYALGANSYVRKPVDFGEFIEAVRQLGMYWLVLNQRPPRGPDGGARRSGVLFVEETEEDDVIVRRHPRAAARWLRSELGAGRRRDEPRRTSALSGRWDVVLCDYELPGFDARCRAHPGWAPARRPALHHRVGHRGRGDRRRG